MKFIAALVASAMATRIADENQDKLNMFEFDNAKMLWENNYDAYKDFRFAQDADGDGNNCRLAESDNFLGAQQCKQSWECRGARTCERGGWCSGYDGCEGTPLPMQAPGLVPDN